MPDNNQDYQRLCDIHTRQLASHEIIIKEIHSDIKDIVVKIDKINEKLFTGNGQESLSSRITKLEAKTDRTEDRTTKGIAAALIATAIGIAAAVKEFIIG